MSRNGGINDVGKKTPDRKSIGKKIKFPITLAVSSFFVAIPAMRPREMNMSIPNSILIAATNTLRGDSEIFMPKNTSPTTYSIRSEMSYLIED